MSRVPEYLLDEEGLNNQNMNEHYHKKITVHAGQKDEDLGVQLLVL